MSADNWARCPRCVLRQRRLIEDLNKQIDVAYGLISISDFDDLRNLVSNEESKLADEWGQFRTLREDYEIYGAEEGSVQVSYSAGCSVCLLTLSFKDEHPLPVEESQ